MELTRQQSYGNGTRNLMTNILDMFPDACPQYIRHLCIGKTDNAWDTEHVLRFLLDGTYPKNELSNTEEESIEVNLELLESCFPEADPHFLHYHAVLYVNDEQKLQEFIRENFENGDYPVITKNSSTRKNGQFYICNCCYDEGVKSRDLGTCDNGCVFCKECIQKSVEVSFGQGKLDFPCLLGCSSSFSLQTLEDVLARKFYYKIVQKKQIQEVKDAQIEDLEMCPFCDFAIIPVEGDKVFRCQNPDCLKESCLLCKELSHLPLHCDEVEKPADVQKRTYIENKMSEALIRSCYKCNIKYIKSDGCNRMKCPHCSAMMCYLCGSPVKDYSHFNGPGGEKFHLCPLFSDTDELHKENVFKGGEIAKRDISLNKYTSNGLKSNEISQKRPRLPIKLKRPAPDRPPPLPARQTSQNSDQIPKRVRNENARNGRQDKDRKNEKLAGKNGRNKVKKSQENQQDKQTHKHHALFKNTMNHFMQMLGNLHNSDENKGKVLVQKPNPNQPPPVPPRTYKNRPK